MTTAVAVATDDRSCVPAGRGDGDARPPGPAGPSRDGSSRSTGWHRVRGAGRLSPCWVSSRLFLSFSGGRSPVSSSLRRGGPSGESPPGWSLPWACRVHGNGGIVGAVGTGRKRAQSRLRDVPGPTGRIPGVSCSGARSPRSGRPYPRSAAACRSRSSGASPRFRRDRGPQARGTAGSCGEWPG